MTSYPAQKMATETAVNYRPLLEGLKTEFFSAVSMHYNQAVAQDFDGIEKTASPILGIRRNAEAPEKYDVAWFGEFKSGMMKASPLTDIWREVPLDPNRLPGTPNIRESGIEGLDAYTSIKLIEIDQAWKNITEQVTSLRAEFLKTAALAAGQIGTINEPLIDLNALRLECAEKVAALREPVLQKIEKLYNEPHMEGVLFEQLLPKAA